jgi:hypothetical protein
MSYYLTYAKFSTFAVGPPEPGLCQEGEGARSLQI